MIGGTTKGFCLREWELWYGDRPAKKVPGQHPCPLPLSDGKACGDKGIGGKRCPYSSKLRVDLEACKLTTYAKIKAAQESHKPPENASPLATGGAGLKAHNPEKL